MADIVTEHRKRPFDIVHAFWAGLPGALAVGAGTLLRVARALDEDKHRDDSLAVLKQSKALFPQSADVAAALGGALVQAGDVAGGKAELERALSIDPNNMGAKMGLDRLNHPPAAPPKP